MQAAERKEERTRVAERLWQQQQQLARRAETAGGRECLPDRRCGGVASDGAQVLVATDRVQRRRAVVTGWEWAEVRQRGMQEREGRARQQQQLLSSGVLALFGGCALPPSPLRSGLRVAWHPAQRAQRQSVACGLGDAHACAVCTGDKQPHERWVKARTLAWWCHDGVLTQVDRGWSSGESRVNRGWIAGGSRDGTFFARLCNTSRERFQLN